MRVRIFTDIEGNEWLMTENDEFLRDEHGHRIPPTQTSRIEKSSSGFTTYNTSQGHCALCGSLKCKGNCFK